MFCDGNCRGTVRTTPCVMLCHTRNYLEGQGDLLSSFITPISHVITSIIPIINTYLLTKSP